jgi:hypothetical protein
LSATEHPMDAYSKAKTLFVRKVMNVPQARALLVVLSIVIYVIATVLITMEVNAVLGIVLGAAPWVIGCAVTLREIIQDRR